MSIGNRIFLQRPQGNPELLKAYEQLPAANIADTMNRIAVLGNGIKRISAPKKPIMAGFAITVKARAGDNLMLHAALDMATENDVIVVSNEGDRSRALMGRSWWPTRTAAKKSPELCSTAPSVISTRFPSSTSRSLLPAQTRQAPLRKGRAK